MQGEGGCRRLPLRTRGLLRPQGPRAPRGRRRGGRQALLWGHSLGVPTAAADTTSAPILWCVSSFYPYPKATRRLRRGRGEALAPGGFPKEDGGGERLLVLCTPPTPLRVGSAVESGDTLWVPGGSLCKLVALPLGPVLGVSRRRRTIFLQAKGAPTWGKLRHGETLQEEGGSLLG